VSGVPILVDYDDREESGRRQLLAVYQLWRGVERLAPRRRAQGSARVEVVDRDLVHGLRELIAALDRRVPRGEEAAEATIARDAAVLRAKAVHRLAELGAAVGQPRA
jgi:hypothetical protein